MSLIVSYFIYFWFSKALILLLFCSLFCSFYLQLSSGYCSCCCWDLPYNSIFSTGEHIFYLLYIHICCFDCFLLTLFIHYTSTTLPTPSYEHGRYSKYIRTCVKCTRVWAYDNDDDQWLTTTLCYCDHTRIYIYLLSFL